jgi:hypothetical protein
MSDLHELRTRLRAAQGRILAVPATGPGVFGAPDPKTGERWNAGNVLGHVAEMLPFWVDQVRGVLAGRKEVGRGVEGYERRKQGIEAGATLTEEELRTRVESGVSLAAVLLDEMSPADLQRRIVYRRRDGEEEATLGELVDQLIVGHLDEHAQQLAELS